VSVSGPATAGIDPSGFNLQLFAGNSTAANFVTGGAGSYYIVGGSGGGVFTGGSAGSNQLYAGSGATTLVGGGANDLLWGGSGTSVLQAATSGFQDLVAGSGATTLIGAGSSGYVAFDFTQHTAGNTYIVQNFISSNDLLWLNNAADETAAISGATVTSGNTTLTLADNTKIVLQGFTGTVSNTFIGHG